MKLLTLIAIASPLMAQFTDTSGNISSAASTLFLRCITTGCSPTTFCPANPILRQEVATFVVRAIYSAINGDPENFSYTASPAYFTDMPSTSPYYKYVQKFRDLGLTSGCQPNVFCSTGQVTNGEMAVFVSRMRQIIAGQPSVGSPDCSPYGDHRACSSRYTFPFDFGSYSSWAHDFAEYVYAIGGFIPILECGQGASFCSSNSSSRGQVAMDIIGVGYAAGFTPSYPSVDKLLVTATPGNILQWYNGVAGQVQLRFASPVSPMPIGTTLSIGCGGPGSTSILDGGSPTMNQNVTYNVGAACKQVFARVDTVGGQNYSFAWFTPAAVGSSVIGTNPIDTTP